MTAHGQAATTDATYTRRHYGHQATQCACPCHGDEQMHELDRLGFNRAVITPTEAAILMALMPPGTIRSHAHIINLVWPESDVAEPALHRLRVNMTRLRENLEWTKSTWQIINLLGHGYRLVSR